MQAGEDGMSITDEELAAIRRAKALPHDDRAWDAAVVAERLITAYRTKCVETSEMLAAQQAERKEVNRLTAEVERLEKIINEEM